MTQRLQVYRGDCVDELRMWFAPDSVDACVCDPPYGLSKEPDIVEVLTHWLAGDDYKGASNGFMGKTWDSFVPGPATWREVYRVLKPGGYLLAFGGSKTADLLSIAIRLAGFDMFDNLDWLYGQGMNKVGYLSYQLERTLCVKVKGQRVYSDTGEPMRTAPPFRHPDADAVWPQGGALKPAREPIVVARKPLGARSLIANVLLHGTGGLNIDGCRIATSDDLSNHGCNDEGDRKGAYGASGERPRGQTEGQKLGRWPANVLLGCACVEPHEPDCPVRILDEQSGPAGAQSQVGFGYLSAPTDGIYGEMGRMASPHSFYADKGGASRFFYTSKADNGERWGYCETCQQAFNRKADGHLHPKPHKVVWHPTVKPVDLMQWLVRLVTPPGGLVLDPFAGTGTTGEAALLEGFRVALVEQDAIYAKIIRARLAAGLS